MNISPLLFLVSDGDRPLPPGHSTLRHRDFTRAPSLPAQDQPSPPDRKPRLFNKRIILWGTEKCCRNVTAVRYDRRARRAERVGRSFIGIGVRMQLRRSRTRSLVTRERYRGYLRKQASHPTLYKDHQPPTTQLGFPPCKIAATPSQNFRSAPRHGLRRRPTPASRHPAGRLLLLSPHPPISLLP